MRLAVAFAITILQAAAVMGQVREVVSQATLFIYQDIPGFYQGYVFWADKYGHIKLYSPTGQLAFEENVQQDMAPFIMGVAVDSDVTVAVSYSNGSRAGIDLLDSTGKLLRSFDTGRYVAAHMAFGDDHSIWTFGWQGVPQSLNKPTGDHMTVHHYGTNGRELGEYLPRSLFSTPRSWPPAGCYGWQQQGIYVANDRIGVLSCSGKPRYEWLELDLNGNLIGRWQITPELLVGRVAFTRDANLYVQDSANRSDPVFRLDRLASAYEQVPLQAPGPLYGANGDELVFADWRNGPMRFLWYRQP